MGATSQQRGRRSRHGAVAGLVGLIAVVSGFDLAPAGAAAAAPSPAAGAVLSATPGDLGFGPTRVGDVAGPLEVTLTNVGDAADTVTGLGYGGPDLTDFVLSSTCTTLAPGQSCAFSVYFLPGAPGERQSSVTVHDTSAAGPVLTFTGTGTEGYDEVTSQGAVYPFGDAQPYGSTSGVVLDEPVVGAAMVPGGGGYWLVAADGGIFAFGDAGFVWSLPGLNIHVDNIVGAGPN